MSVGHRLLPSIVTAVTCIAAGWEGPAVSQSVHAASGPRIDRVSHDRRVFATYQLIELHIAVRASYHNPFDPAQIDVYATFLSQAGREYRVNGFYFQDYFTAGGGQVSKVGRPEWRIRFACPTPGTWSYRVYVGDSSRQVTSSTMGSPIRVAAGSSPGYVRVSRYDRHYLAFDNGQSYFLVGENLAFWYHGMQDYYFWLRTAGRLRGSGANAVRIWMAPQKDSVDYSYPLGNYSSGLQEAWALDQILSWADQDQIKVILTLQLHANLQTRRSWSWDWSHNPCNRRRGGPAGSPCDFFSNPTAVAMFQRNLRYVVARWGYSPAILAWELLNEGDLVDGYRSCSSWIVDWHRTMIGTLQRLDPTHHLITTTFAHMPGNPRIWSLPGLDLVQSNHYSPTIPDYITADLLALRSYGKPAFMGEFGLWPRMPASSRDTTGWHIHVGQWASLLAGGAGSGFNWYWEDYVERYRTYWVYRAIPRFLAGVQLDRQSFQPARPRAQTTSPGSSARVYTLRGRSLSLIWVLRTRGHGASGHISVPAMSTAAARVEWWDTLRGIPLGTAVVHPYQGNLTLTLPGGATDYAARVWE